MKLTSFIDMIVLLKQVARADGQGDMKNAPCLQLA